MVYGDGPHEPISTTCPDCKATNQPDQFCRFCAQHFGPNTNRPMPKPTHPALEALRDIPCKTPVRDHTGERLTCRDMARDDHIPCPVCAAILALEALLAERDELRAALEEIDTMDKEDAPRAAMARTARAALAKGES